MGVFDTITSLLGINLETRLRKAVFVFVVVAGIIILFNALLDPIADRLLNAAFGYTDVKYQPLNAPFSIADLTEYFGDLFPPLVGILEFVRDTTLYSMFFIAGLAAYLVAILLGGSAESTVIGPPIARTFSRLGEFLNKQRDRFSSVDPLTGEKKKYI